MLTSRFQGDVLLISRVRKGNPGYLLAVNFGDAAANANVTSKILPNLGEKGTVEIHSLGRPSLAQKPVAASDGEGDDAEEAEESVEGSTIFFDDIPLEPKEAMLINYVPQF